METKDAVNLNFLSPASTVRENCYGSLNKSEH